MKRIIIITQGLSRIVEPIADFSESEVVGLIECAPRKQYKKDFFGLNVLRTMYHAFSRQSQFPLKSFAVSRDIPYFYMQSSDAVLEDWVRKLSPDIMIVFSMSQLLKKNIYTLPRYGTINLHPSFLPEYRGPNPCFWMYYNMDKQGGSTVHFIDKGEDTGKIILQERFDLPLGIKSPDKFDIAIDKIGVTLLLNAISNIENIVGEEQPLISPTPRARNLKSDEHHSVIDWQEWPVERIWHILRGTESWLNALPQPDGIYDGTRWLIGGYDKVGDCDELKRGVIYKRKGNRFVVCKDGIIYLYCKVNVKNLIIKFLTSWSERM